jgi:double-strand break repair protein MRE11
MDKAKQEWAEANGDRDCPLPLIRLRVDYSGGFDSFNPQRFGQQFVNRVANPKDILLFYRKRTLGQRDKSKGVDIVQPHLPERMEVIQIESLVQEYLMAQNLSVLPEKALTDAVKNLVDNDEKDAISK